jgi:hypothetical protein
MREILVEKKKHNFCFNDKLFDFTWQCCFCFDYFHVFQIGSVISYLSLDLQLNSKQALKY